MEGLRSCLCVSTSSHEESYSEALLATTYLAPNGLESYPTHLHVVYTLCDPNSANCLKEIIDFHDAPVSKVDIGSRKAEIWWFLCLNGPISFAIDTV